MTGSAGGTSRERKRNAVTRHDPRSVPPVVGLSVRWRGPRADLELGASWVDGFIFSFRGTDHDKMQRFHDVGQRRCRRSRQAERGDQRNLPPAGQFMVDEARSRRQALQAVIRRDGSTSIVRRGANRPANPSASPPRLGARDAAAWVAEAVAVSPQSPIAPGDRCGQDPRLLEKGRGRRRRKIGGPSPNRKRTAVTEVCRRGTRGRTHRIAGVQRAGAAGSGEQGRFENNYIIRNM